MASRRSWRHPFYPFFWSPLNTQRAVCICAGDLSVEHASECLGTSGQDFEGGAAAADQEARPDCNYSISWLRIGKLCSPHVPRRPPQRSGTLGSRFGCCKLQAAGYDLSSAYDCTVPGTVDRMKPSFPSAGFLTLAARGKQLVKTDLSIKVPAGTYGRIGIGCAYRTLAPFSVSESDPLCRVQRRDLVSP